MDRTIFTDLNEQTRWFDRDRATEYDEATRWNGHNFISRATGSQWEHETLYQTAKDHRWVLLHDSQWQGSLDTYHEITEQEAYRWLLRNEHAVPEQFAEAREA